MICTKCHKNEAEWFGIDGEDLCQECWEDFCNKDYWKYFGGAEPKEEIKK